MTRAQASTAVDLALALGAAAVIAWGVLALGWSPFVVMLLFWLENVVIGVLHVLKMLATGARHGAGGLAGSLFLSAFFAVHYGLFTAVHGLFVAVLFGSGELGRAALDGGLTRPPAAMLQYLLADRDGWLAALAIVALQASALVQWLARTRAAPPPLKDLMGAPYGRIVILHVTLIASGFLVQALQAPVAGALLLVGLKLAWDVVTLRRDHAGDGRTEDTEPRTEPAPGRPEAADERP